MTNQQILEKAIQKAIEGGWKFFPKGKVNVSDCEDLDHINFEVESWPPFWEIPLYVIIFNHDFAKALWGDKRNYFVYDGINDPYYDGDWKYHLQQMVIADDPIKYLGENL